MSAPDAAEVWTTLLNQFESVLDDRRTRLDSMDPEGAGAMLDAAPNFIPPASVPPLPVACRSRAVALSRRNEELVAELSRAADRIQPARYAVRGRVAVGNTSSTEFDEMA